MKSRVFLLWFFIIFCPNLYGATLQDLYQMALQNNSSWQEFDQEVSQAQWQNQASQGALKPQVGITSSIDYYWFDSNAAQPPSLSNSQINLLNECLIENNDYGVCLDQIADENCEGTPGCVIAQSGANQTINSSKIGLQLKQSLYNPQAWYQAKQGNTQLQQAQIQQQEKQQRFLFTLIDSYLAALSAREELEVTRKEKNSQEQQLQRLEQQFEKGLVNASDVLYARAMFELQSSTVDQQQENALNRYSALEAITQQTIPTLNGLDASIPMPRPNPGTAEGWLEIAIEQSPLLQSLQLNIAMANLEQQQRRGQRKPKLDVIAGVGTSGGDRNNTFGTTGDATSAQLSLQLNIPVYTGGTLFAREREAEHLKQQAQLQLKSAKSQLEQEIQVAFSAAAAGLRQLNIFDKSIEALTLQVENLESGFEQGVVDSQKILEARQLLFKTIVNKQMTRYEYIRASIKLKQLAGILSPQDMLVISSWSTNDTSTGRQQSLFDDAKNWQSY